MVGQREYSTKPCPSLTLETYVPKNNFYRRLKSVLDLSFVYEAVKPYYGKCGQKSIDPVVFLKLLLVGHFENLVSDRAIIRNSQLRLDILYFLDYKLGERLPCHSTVSRTRKRLPASVFETLFEKVVSRCIQAGMVAGGSQAIDAAFVEANASLDKLESKLIMQWKLLKGEAVETDASTTSQAFRLIEKTAKPRKPDRSNSIYQSKTDPEARLAQKAGKPFRLYYLSSMAVDTFHHVITHIQADYADERDSVHLLPMVEKVATRLKQHGLLLKDILADGGFGSGINYALLEYSGYTSYISLQGSYHPLREGFTYDIYKDVYLCRQGKELRKQDIRLEKGFANAIYLAKQSECKACPLKKACCENRGRKKLVVTAYRNQYQRMQQRLESRKGKYMKRRRMATVEPVFGSLLNYYGMWRANARGKQAAHKIMLMAAIAYNLQKLLRGLPHPKVKSQIMVLQQDIFYSLPLCHSHVPFRIQLSYSYFSCFSPLFCLISCTINLYCKSIYPEPRINE